MVGLFVECVEQGRVERVVCRWFVVEKDRCRGGNPDSISACSFPWAVHHFEQERFMVSELHGTDDHDVAQQAIVDDDARTVAVHQVAHDPPRLAVPRLLAYGTATHFGMTAVYVTRGIGR